MVESGGVQVWQLGFEGERERERTVRWRERNREMEKSREG